MRTPIFFAFAVLTAIGCQDPHGPMLVVQMDSAVYARDTTGRANAGFTVTNMGDTPAVYQGCPKPPFAVDSGAPGKWRGYSFNGCQGVVVVIWLALRPGESYRDTFAWDLAATYRIRVRYGPDQTHYHETVGAAFTFR